MGEVIWIGMAHVVPNDKITNVLKGSGGAYVNVVGYGLSGDDFKRRIEIALLEFDLTLIDMEDVELLEARIAGSEPDASMLNLLNELKFDRKIKFSTFHTYKE